MDKAQTHFWRPDPLHSSMFRPPETPQAPMEFLSRSWSVSALEISKTLSSSSSSKPPINTTIEENITEETSSSSSVSLNPFSFASTETTQMIMERIMSQTEDVSVSPRTSGRLSHSSGPLTDSCPVSPSEIDDIKYGRSNNGGGVSLNSYLGGRPPGGGGKTVGRWLKDRKEKKKEEARAHNAQVHAAVSVAAVAAAVAAIAAAMAASSGSGKDEEKASTDSAVASAATLVAAQCVETAEALGAEREHLAAVVSSAVNVRSAGDIMTLTAAAATALRGAATLKARALKEVWNIAAVIPVERNLGASGGNGNGSSHSSFSGELVPEDIFSGTIYIKPHNVLLDETFTPKISDFGLAKLCSKNISVVSMTAARGTLGYMAPEVLSRNFGNVSLKSDIYSYGMLLLEMVGGRKNVDSSSSAETFHILYPEWIHNLLEGDIHINIEDEASNVKIAKKLAMVGLWCIQWQPMNRPSIKSVIQMLETEDDNQLTFPPNPFHSTNSITTSEGSSARQPFQMEVIQE